MRIEHTESSLRCGAISRYLRATEHLSGRARSVKTKVALVAGAIAVFVCAALAAVHLLVE